VGVAWLDTLMFGQWGMRANSVYRTSREPGQGMGGAGFHGLQGALMGGLRSPLSLPVLSLTPGPAHVFCGAVHRRLARGLQSPRFSFPSFPGSFGGLIKVSPSPTLCDPVAVPFALSRSSTCPCPLVGGPGLGGWGGGWGLGSSLHASILFS